MKGRQAAPGGESFKLGSAVDAALDSVAGSVDSAVGSGLDAGGGGD